MSTLNIKSVFEILKSNQKSGSVAFGRGKSSITSTKNIWQIFLGYRRYKGFDKSNSEGQDNALIGQDDRFIAGVVADGVSQSFFGNIAAEVVSEKLFDYLWENRYKPPDEEKIVAFLNNLCPIVDKYIGSIKLSDKSTLLSKALEEARTDGTQTVFSAFILDTATLKATLYSVGDIELFVYTIEKDIKKTRKIKTNSNGRWASTLKSDMHLTINNLSDVNGILAYSDGMIWKDENDWGNNFNLNSLKQFPDLAETRASQDDISFICAVTENLICDTGKDLGISDIPFFQSLSTTTSKVLPDIDPKPKPDLGLITPKRKKSLKNQKKSGKVIIYYKIFLKILCGGVVLISLSYFAWVFSPKARIAFSNLMKSLSNFSDKNNNVNENTGLENSNSTGKFSTNELENQSQQPENLINNPDEKTTDSSINSSPLKKAKSPIITNNNGNQTPVPDLNNAESEPNKPEGKRTPANEVPNSIKPTSDRNMPASDPKNTTIKPDVKPEQNDLPEINNLIDLEL